MDAFEDGGEAAVETLLAQHPEIADAARTRLDALKAAGLLHDEADETVPERLGEFRILKRLGSGGMGVVYLAEQETLGRRVALKVVRPDYALFPAARERFRREVEAIARLDHPGIATIHVVGEEAKVPYFAMEYVVGASLDVILERLRGERPNRLRGSDLTDALADRVGDEVQVDTRAEVFSGSWVDVCAKLARRIVEALAHAHERGVLHRDIKPSNIMVTPDGGVRVLDFGLARADDAAPITRSGSVLGSLPYMAPEQVRGEAAHIDRRTDVYGMGVTLYEMLALQPAYWAESYEATRQRVLDGSPVRIERLNGAVPWDAETICLTAMDVDPARRYPSMAAFADDLDRFLRRQTIAARRPGPVLRVRRWGQRRPAMATALALGAVVAVGAPLGFALQEEAAASRVQVAHDEEAAQRKRSEQSLKAAIAAIDTLVRQARDPALTRSPDTDALRSNMLEKARGHYEQLLEQEGDHAGLGWRVVRAYISISRLRYQFRDFEGSESAALRAVESCEALRKQGPISTPAWVDAETSLIRVWTEQGKLQQAGERAETFVAKLSEGELPPEDRDYYLAEAWRVLGVVHHRRSDIDAAIPAFRSAAQHYEQALEQPNGERARDALASTLQTLAYTIGIYRLGDYREPYARAIQLMKKDLESTPESPNRRHRLGQATAAWAHVELEHQRVRDALRKARDADELLESVAREFPSRPGYSISFMSNALRFAKMLLEIGDSSRAEDRLRAGIELGEIAVERAPQSRLAAYRMALLEAELAQLLLQEQRGDEAEPHWQRADNMWSIALDSPQPHRTFVAEAGVFYSHWAQVERKAGRRDHARDLLQTSCHHHTTAASLFGRHLYRERLGLALLHLAEIEVEDGQDEAAVAALQRALTEGEVTRDRVAGAPFAEALGERADYRRLLER